MRLGEHVRQAIAIAVARDAAGERKEIGSLVLEQQFVLRQRAAPGDALRDTQFPRPRSHLAF